MELQQLQIILVEPAGPLNVGSVARVMKNFGLSRLTVVNPHCDLADPQAQQMAVHGKDVLGAARVVPTLGAALTGVHQAIATTGRLEPTPFPLQDPRQLLPQLLTQNSAPGYQVALMFGREDSGLTQPELSRAHQVIGIPSSDRYPSLNLAQAVAICCYELFRGQAVAEGKRPTPEALETVSPASLDQLEGYYRHLETVLLGIGYLQPHTAAARMDKFRNIFKRAMLSDQEVAMLRGILRQTEWALRNTPPPH